MAKSAFYLDGRINNGVFLLLYICLYLVNFPQARIIWWSKGKKQNFKDTTVADRDFSQGLQQHGWG